MTSEITALSHSFELLQETVLKELDLTKSNVSQLCEAVAGVYPDKAIPRSVMTEMQAATGSHNLFAVITRHGMWNYINHRLLEYMVEKTVPQNNHLQNEIEVHKRKVEAFLKRTPIHDYIDSCSELASGKTSNVMPVHEFPPDPAMFVPFQLTFSDKLLSQSMGVIVRLQNHVMKHFSLPHPTLLLGAVSTGSTVVSFHFPSVELERVSSLARKSSGFFSELNVETVSIDNHGIGTLPVPMTQVSLKSILFQVTTYSYTQKSLFVPGPMQTMPSGGEQQVRPIHGQFPGERGTYNLYTVKILTHEMILTIYYSRLSDVQSILGSNGIQMLL